MGDGALVYRAGDKLLANGSYDQGKTTFLRHLATSTPAAIVFDPEGEFDDAPFVAVDVDDASAAVMRHPYVAVQADDLEADFEAFCLVGQQLANWLVVIDEISHVVQGTGTKSIPPAFSRLWRRGHKVGTGIAWATHRLKEVPGLLRMTRHKVFFFDDVPLNVDAIRELVGDAADQVPKLDVGHYLYKPPTGPPVVCPPVPREPGVVEIGGT